MIGKAGLVNIAGIVGGAAIGSWAAGEGHRIGGAFAGGSIGSVLSGSSIMYMGANVLSKSASIEGRALGTLAKWSTAGIAATGTYMGADIIRHQRQGDFKAHNWILPKPSTWIGGGLLYAGGLGLAHYKYTRALKV